MKTLYKMMSIGLIIAPLMFGGCAKPDPEQPKKEIKYVRLLGTVFSERYMPAAGSSFNSPDIESRYSFSMDVTSYFDSTGEVSFRGRKAIQVKSAKGILKESIDALIEPETRVMVKIKKDELEQQVYVVPADRIEIK